MGKDTVIIFTRNGMGEGPSDLQFTLVNKFLQITFNNITLPIKMLFYTNGIKLTWKSSWVIEILKQYGEKGVELVICSNCHQRLGLA